MMAAHANRRLGKAIAQEVARKRREWRHVCNLCGGRTVPEDLISHPSDPETGAPNEEIVCCACRYDREVGRKETYCVCCRGRLLPGDDIPEGCPEYEAVCADCANRDHGEPDILHEAKDSIEAGVCAEDFDYVEDAA